MDLSIVVFDLRDAIKGLREDRAALLKRIEALEDKPDHGGAANSPRNECAQVEFALNRPACEIQRGKNHCNDEQPHEEGCVGQNRIIPPPRVRHQRLEALEALIIAEDTSSPVAPRAGVDLHLITRKPSAINEPNKYEAGDEQLNEVPHTFILSEGGSR
jgi:hypothetical protein